MPEGKVKFGVIGFGHWGPNLARAVHNNPFAELVGIAERDSERASNAIKLYSNTTLFQSGEELINSSVDAIIIATPTYTHFNLARAALLAGKHVLVEKPLTASSSEAFELVALAKEKGLVLMVDHILLYTGAALEIQRLNKEGFFGTLQHFDATRFAFGLYQPDVNVLWDLSPHDIAIMLSLQKEKPVEVRASGICHTGNGLENIGQIEVTYESGFYAVFRASWSSPLKVRQTLVAGTSGMAFWDDMNAEARLKTYQTSIEHTTIKVGKKIKVEYKNEGPSIPLLDSTEPLQGLITDFCNAIQLDTTPISSGEVGANVVRLLELSQEALQTKQPIKYTEA